MKALAGKRSFGTILRNENLIMDSPFYFYFIYYGENNSSKMQRQKIVFIVLILPSTIYKYKVVM